MEKNMSANGVTTTQGRNSWITRTTAPIQYFDLKEHFELEGGGYLPELRLAYCTYGTLNETADNVIWVCHALTANSDAQDWWSGFWGKGKLFDPERYFIVCANINAYFASFLRSDVIHHVWLQWV